MDLDLGRALHDAAHSGTAHRASIDAEPVLRRIRRRRTARHAMEGTVGVAAVGALALGAVQVTGLRDPAPVAPVAPATGTPTPSSSPTDDASARWPAVSVNQGLACGVPVPDVLDPPGDADLRFEPVVAAGRDGVSGPLLPGDPVMVDARLVNGTDQELDAVATGPVRVWFVQGGTVVGQLDVDEASAGTGTEYAGGPDASFSGVQPSGVPVACAPDGGVGGEPLGPAEYAVHVVQELRLSDDVTVRVTGEPVPVVVATPDGGTLDPHPDLTELEVSPAGLGPLAVGMPPAGNPGAAMIELDPDACAGVEGGEPARWIASGYPDETVDGQPRAPFSVAADETSVQWIDVRVPSVRTAEGVGIGTTVDHLRAAYPMLEGPFDGPVSRVWWLTGPIGTLVFETQGDELGLQPAGTPESVVLVRVLAAGIDPAFATANSDQVAGGCL